MRYSSAVPFGSGAGEPGCFRGSIAAGAVIAAALLFAPAARAGVPYSQTSTVPVCVVASPDGTFLTTVIVRDIALNPVSSSRVTLDFSACGVFVTCAVPCAGCTAYPASQRVEKFTDVNGVATFDLRMGGACPNERIWIYADGVLLRIPAFSTLDQNGDLSVTGADLVSIQAAQLSGDLSADFDCSGTVTAADLAIAQAHIGVTCNGVVPALHRTWGTLKGAYR